VQVKPSEQSVAAKVVAYLESCGHDVYQEVTLRTQGAVADIVAIAGPEIWIVEVKVSWSLDLLQQCIDRKTFAHRVFAAVPSCRGWRERAVVAHALGFGTIQIVDLAEHETWAEGTRLVGPMPPRLTSQRLPLRDKLCEGHKTHAKAGVQGGNRYTPWRRTCEALVAVARQSPGLTIREAVVAIKNGHYASPASARSSLLQWATSGKIPGLRVDRDGKVFRLYADAAQVTA